MSQGPGKARIQVAEPRGRKGGRVEEWVVRRGNEREREGGRGSEVKNEGVLEGRGEREGF